MNVSYSSCSAASSCVLLIILERISQLLLAIRREIQNSFSSTKLQSAILKLLLYLLYMLYPVRLQGRFSLKLAKTGGVLWWD